MAGVRLAAIGLRDSDAPTQLVDHIDGEDVLISDYLMSEVLSRQAPDVQEFLLRTAVPNSSTPA
jgi:ATP/maltotriose-dependent transcriptional regulator MalT